MAEQFITDKYAIYNDDCMEVMPKLPDASIGLSIYSPPFPGVTGGLYHYSSSPRDLSNNRSYDEFMTNYEYVVAEIRRLTMPGRMTCVHCMDIPVGNSGSAHDYLLDFPGDIIRLHAKYGFKYTGRHSIWKEPLGVRLRTMAKKLTHQTIVEDSTLSACAGSDYLLVFRNEGENQCPVEHPTGLLEYYGEREIPAELLPFKGWTGKQTENRYSHWIWRQYASSFWDDIRLDNVLPFIDSKEPDDEKHVHPLQLDVINRCVILYSNLGDVVFTPFMGVGSEVYGAVSLGRTGVGVELKYSYYKQAKLNLEHIEQDELSTQTLFDFADEEA